MKKLLSALIAGSLVLAPLALVPSIASAKTATQKKNEAKGAAAKQKSAAKSASKKKK
jgi:Ni/Co efflux regulator RcnB